MHASITGLCAADVDNDSKQEVIIVSKKCVSINRVEHKRLVKVAEIAKTRTSTYISVDAADINKNGRPEIYVTSLGPGQNALDSFVMEHTGADYKVISTSQSRYYRIVPTTDRGAILLGQRQRMDGESISGEPIHEMSWQDGRLVPGRQYLKGGQANLMGLTHGDIIHAGQPAMAAYSDWDRLRIFSTGGETLWRDAERSGGNTTYFNLSQIEPGHKNQHFLPLRIRTADMDRDGQSELLRVRHDELAQNLTKSFRAFSKARIECLAWDGLGLVPRWKTRSFGGRVSDFLVHDVDNDGTDELLIAVISKEETLAKGDAVSRLIAFDLDTHPHS